MRSANPCVWQDTLRSSAWRCYSRHIFNKRPSEADRQQIERGLRVLSPTHRNWITRVIAVKARPLHDLKDLQEADDL